MATREEVNMDIALTAIDRKNNHTPPARYGGCLKLKDNMGLTKLELIRILVNIEDKYKITISKDKIESMTTLDELVDTIVEKTQSK